MNDESRKKAEKWVNGYTATAVAIVVVTAPIPGTATIALCAIEATMCYQIGKIYQSAWTAEDASATATAIGLVGFVAPIAALEAASLLGPLAFVAKPGIAAGIVKAMGQLVIKHFEDIAA